ncbi:SpoVR family protein [Roseomonas xinghualingensis]|uniref:SpoVR family protein n=1 Tax=Roseomonas xinghualingensis TaxID=2986475 RepID=UPI0021F18570|nr:SpoVR family protein [Roseomonas sp. SXEYE001]MCV4206320.1 SpoVR family protein [Roseomonas sp. SXEYE001]
MQLSLLYEGNDWDFHTLRRSYEAIERIACDELGLEVYPNRIEVITAEQMLDVYTAHGMPITYRHWSYGKRFLQHEASYRRGITSLAYEVVINSNPCISYLMEENTATMQAMVIAHAAFGHNHFFRSNHLFRQWTDASAILDYLEFARSYIATCEDRHGTAAVERVLDAAHALSRNGVHRDDGVRPLNLKGDQKRERERREYDERLFNDLWRTVPGTRPVAGADVASERRRKLGLPEENLLYFLEKVSPRLQPWEREVIRIVRLIAQYFYPQPQVKLMNEGCATWVHQRIMTRLHETGQINDAAFLEVIHSTSNVITQLGFDHPFSSGGFNPYALGYAMMGDIERICTNPAEEDRRWFPEIAGNGDPLGTLRYAWENFRDESFVLQFLSPALIRRFRMFRLLDDTAEATLLVDAIHDDAGYRAIRRSLARSYDPAESDADVQVVDVDLAGDRRLMLQHRTRSGRRLEKRDAEATLSHTAALWGYDVRLEEVEADTGAVLAIHTARPPAS